MTAKTGKIDPNKFEGEGLNFRAKLIGVDDVAEARGDKMCQMSMQKLKASVKSAGEHKQRIVVNVSLEGLKIIDGVSMAIQYTHAVHRISFIARDVSDSRAFGYIFGVGDGTHKFFAIKTEKQAEQLVLTLRDLFQAVYDMKKQEVEDAKKKQEEDHQQQQQQLPPETPVAEGEQKPAEAAPDAQEAVYQVPNNDVSPDSPEHIYSVPQNNAPVAGEEKKSGSNLLDLEDQLENIELGIQQMSSFDMLDTNTPDASKSTTDPWGTSTSQADIKRNASGSNLDDLAGLQSGFGAQNAFPPTSQGFGANTANPFSAPTSQPFGGQPFGQATSQPFGQPAATQPFGQPATSQPFGQPATSQPFGQPATSQPFGQPATSQPFGQPATSQPFGQPATSQPFGQPATSQPFGPGPGALPPGAAFGMPGTPMPGAQAQVRPGFGQPAAGGFGQPAPAGFGQQAFGGALRQPTAGGFGQPAAFPGGFGAFGAAQPAMGQPQQNLFPDTEPDPNILTPTVLNEPEVEEITTEPKKKDAFADLVNIGGSDPKKSPKAIFEAMSAPPKKSLNELKVDVVPPRTPSPGIPSPGVMSPGVISPGIQQQASDPFGPLGKEADRLRGLADSSEDPFDTSHVHIPQPTSQPSSSTPPDVDPFMPAMTLSSRLSCDNMPKKQTQADVSKHEHLPKKSPKRLTNGNIPVFSDDFNLPSPEEPPPPLPAEVKLSLPGGAPPPPPPRPKVDTNSASVRPRPVPKPRKNTSTSSSPSPSSATDPFSPSSNTDPFSDSFPSAPSTLPTHKSTDPFLSSQPSFDSKPFGNWDPFSDFSSDIFKNNCFTVFDSSTEKNGPASVSEQHK
ncbi:disabled homolog 1-like isoform X3 [Haliotis rufescens]|uniref:disabled homolog 1-like isoform X3 n=1 Tax=Haliotis rufescens TaxID=6454 RepID=UPI00201EA5F4|nr:disabled homolog 1-like isoform X3 [Haliotis rufescens]